MKISDLPVLSDAKGNAYIPVVDPDETDPALQNKRIYISTLSAAAVNFEPYDPAKEYNNVAPDFVSYNGNVYEYIFATPATGVTPTNTSNWRIVSAGQFAHIQNTDSGTRNPRFDIAYNSQDQNPDGITVLGFGTQQGGAVPAIGLHWENDGVNPATQVFKICYNYTGTGSDVWEDFGGTLPANVALLDGGQEFVNGFGIMQEASYSDSFNAFYIARAGVGSNLFSVNGEGVMSAYGPINEQGVPLATKYGKVFKTGTVVDFVAAETHFGTEAVPETGNITANMTGAGVGNMAFMTHNGSVEPTIDPAVFHKISGSGDYALGVNNYIIFDCLSTTKVNYSITQ